MFSGCQLSVWNMNMLGGNCAPRQLVQTTAIHSPADFCAVRKVQTRCDSGCKFERVPSSESLKVFFTTDLVSQCPGGISVWNGEDFLTSISESYVNSHLQFWLGGSESPAMVLLKGFASSNQKVLTPILLPVQISETGTQCQGGISGRVLGWFLLRKVSASRSPGWVP